MATSALPKRQDVPKEHTWNLESIYQHDDQWEQDFKKLAGLIPQLAQLSGTLGADGESLLDALQQRDEASKLLFQMYVYVHLRHYEDLTNPHYQALTDRASSMAAQFGAATAFFEPEILAIPDQQLDEFFQSVDALGVYKHELSDIRRQREHIRSAEVEALLASAQDVTRSPDDIFGMLVDADLKFPVIKDDKGNDVELTHARYVPVFMESPNRDVRRSAFEALYTTYGNYRNTIGTSFASHIRSRMFFAKARNYKSTLHAALEPNAIPIAVYTNLIETVNDNLQHMHRYMLLRKRLLQLDELHMYDLFTPLVSNIDVKYSYDQAREMVVAGLTPLGGDYVNHMRHGLYEGRWVDVYENVGKRSGAFSWGAYTTQPFIMMNYQDNLDNVLTLAHELGHSMHSFYTRRTQPYVYGSYTIFVAEVASTLNEALLTHHLLQTTDDPRLRMYVLNDQIEKLRATLYRQTMFAEFEYEAHRRMEAGEALTSETFSAFYYDLNKRYFGPEVVVDDLIRLEWSRIPHFYSSFYVYQYATGIAASTALAKQILSEGQPAVDRYLKFLSGGSSKHSIDLLRDAGVDMTSPEPVAQACQVFGELVTQMEQLAAQIDGERRN